MLPVAGETLTWFSPFTTIGETSGTAQAEELSWEHCSNTYPVADAGQATTTVLFVIAKIRREGGGGCAMPYARAM